MRPAAARLLVCTLTGVSILGPLACGGLGPTDEELPAEPLAIHYRTPEEARRRAEAIVAQGPAPGAGAPAAPQRVARGRLIPHFDQLRELLQGASGAPAERPSHLGRLALLDARSGSVTPVSGARRGAIPLDWSEDHGQLLFVQPEGRGLQLFELRAADGRVHPLTRGEASHVQGCYAAGGRLVVVEARPGAEGVESRILRSGPEGRAPFVAISAGPEDHSPACSPRGSEIAWVAEARRGRPLIQLGTLEGDEAPRPLFAGRDPIYHPSSGWLLFSAPLGREWRLWRARPGAGGRVPIGRGTLDEFRPAVSPDGRFVVYVASHAPARRQLHLRRYDGSGDRLLLWVGDADHPVW